MVQYVIFIYNVYMTICLMSASIYVDTYNVKPNGVMMPILLGDSGDVKVMCSIDISYRKTL